MMKYQSDRMNITRLQRQATVQYITQATALSDLFCVLQTSQNLQRSITCNGISVTVSENCVIDCDKQSVTDVNGNSIMKKIKGSFFELETGANTINLSTTATVEFSFYPQYVWNTETEDIYKWDR